MPATKDELRAEVAALREELAAERARTEALREQWQSLGPFRPVVTVRGPSAAETGAAVLRHLRTLAASAPMTRVS